jgi:hypothetical protein
MNFKQLLFEATEYKNGNDLAKAILRGQTPVSAKEFFGDRYEAVKGAIESNHKSMASIMLNLVVSFADDFPTQQKNAVINMILKKAENWKDIPSYLGPMDGGLDEPEMMDAYFAYFSNLNKEEVKTNPEIKELFKQFEEHDNRDKWHKEFEQKVNKFFEKKNSMKIDKSEINKLYEDDIWLMVIPKTYAASKKYGENTKWCTTMNNLNFDNYSKKCELIIVINKKTNKKYQLHKETDSFMDETDKEPKDIASIMNEFPIEIIKILKKYKINIADYELEKAIADKNIEKMKESIKKGANLNYHNGYFLRKAIFTGNLEIVKLLLDSGVDVHLEDDEALKLAIFRGDVEIVKLLLNKGASVKEVLRKTIFGLEDVTFNKFVGTNIRKKIYSLLEKYSKKEKK